MPINNITQTISTLPPAGRRGVDVQTQFVLKQEDFQDHLQGITVGELNTLKTQINTTVTGMNIAVETINTKASEASTSASSASTSANTATTKAGEASASASNANVYSLKAGKWADNNYNVEVEAGKYSAKHWATEASIIIGGMPEQIANKADISYVNGKYSGFKNYIINGDFKVNQYNADTVSAITAAGVFACDRFYGFASQNGKITTQRRSSGAVAMGDAQFENCLQVLTVAGYAPNSTDSFNITQKIEGLNIANLRFGTSNAKTITLSFWVRSSVVGLHCVSFKNSASNRSYVATYTINSANTFEYKTITIQGDTTGTWLYNSGVGLHMSFTLAIGSSFSTPTPNQWVSGTYSTTVGAVNDIATTGNEFILTGVQLEEGSVATPFENRPYGLELSLCQRYYQGLNTTFSETLSTNGGISTKSISLPTTMRISPIVVEDYQSGIGVGSVSSSPTSPTTLRVNHTLNATAWFRQSYYRFSAEL